MAEVTQATEAPAMPADGDRQPGIIRRYLRAGLVLHPFLMAAFPIVFLYARNVHEAITPGEMLLPLGWSVGGTAVFMLVGWAIFRNAKAVGLVATAWLLLFFSYGRASTALQGTVLGRTRYLLVTWALAALAATAVAFLLKSRLVATTRALNLITAVLVAMNLVPIARYRPPAASGSDLSGEAGRALAAAKSTKQELPDIYYIVPEDYGDERTLREKGGVDTHWFVRYLEDEGFYVAKESLANYQWTHMALSATLNLQYLSTLLGDRAGNDASVEGTLKGFAVAKFFQALGYRYVHIGYWWPPTQTDPSADINVKPGSLSEFSSILYDTTMLPTLSRKLDVKQEILDTRRAKYNYTLQELEDIPLTMKLRGPKFVFVHLGIPHLPQVFDRKGNYVEGTDKTTRKDIRHFGDQVYYTTVRLQQLIGDLLRGTGRKAVIILQTDEGPDLEHTRVAIRKGRFEHEDMRDALLAKYRILNALFLPGVSHDQLYPSITPVNTFRLVFDLYFHAGLGLLPDQVWAMERHPTRFVDIAKLLKGE
jgi:hypothetical protein